MQAKRFERAVTTFIGPGPHYNECVELSEALLENVIPHESGAKVFYGMYQGDDCQGDEYFGHAWIVFPDDSIIDPSASQFPDWSLWNFQNEEEVEQYLQQGNGEASELTELQTMLDRAKSFRAKYHLPGGPRFLAKNHPVRKFYVPEPPPGIDTIFDTESIRWSDGGYLNT